MVIRIWKWTVVFSLSLGKDSVNKICSDLGNIKQRLDAVETLRHDCIHDGNKEIADLRVVLNETEDRVKEDNTTHSKIINAASTIKTSIQLPKEPVD